MPGLKKTPDIADPSDIIQVFPKYNLQLLCCRYWWLKKWEFRDLAFPFWRIYYDENRGAYLIYNEIGIELSPDKIYLIAPNTSYATRLFEHRLPDSGFLLEGGRIVLGKIDEEFQRDDIIKHLFIHFNIGMPYDNVSSEIFSFEITAKQRGKIDTIKKNLLIDASQFGFQSFFSIQSLISDLLSEIDKTHWNLLSKDHRILQVLDYIEDNLSSDLSNDKLAKSCRLATNSFTRLFTSEINLSPQRYVKKKRIDKACILILHSEDSIDKIAEETGFANRYHFSRVFKEVSGQAPARYRKEFFY